MAAVCVNQTLKGQECPLSERVVPQNSPDSQKASRLDLLENLTSLMAGVMDGKENKPCSLKDSTIISSLDLTITPAFLMDVAKMETFQRLIHAARREAKKNAADDGAHDRLATDTCDRFAVEVGLVLLRLSKSGRIAIEIDPELSFDAEASVEKARKLVSLFEAHNVDMARVLIKLVSTWESVQASRKLEKEGINCNLTSLLKKGSLPQDMCHSWAWPEEDLDKDTAFELLPGDGKKLRDFVNLTLFEAKENATDGAHDRLASDACDRFSAEVGLILLHLPKSGRVSIEIDPELSFNAEASFEKARKIVSLFEAHHVHKERVLVRLVSTWESIQASRKLEKEGINCNLTSLLKNGLLPQNMCHSWAWPDEELDKNRAFQGLPGDGKKHRDFANLTLFEG